MATSEEEFQRKLKQLNTMPNYNGVIPGYNNAVSGVADNITKGIDYLLGSSAGSRYVEPGGSGRGTINPAPAQENVPYDPSGATPSTPPQNFSNVPVQGGIQNAVSPTEPMNYTSTPVAGGIQSAISPTASNAVNSNANLGTAQTASQLVDPQVARESTGSVNQYSQNPMRTIQDLANPEKLAQFQQANDALRGVISAPYTDANTRALGNYDTVRGLTPTYDNSAYQKMADAYLGKNQQLIDRANNEATTMNMRDNYYYDRLKNLQDTSGTENSLARFFINRGQQGTVAKLLGQTTGIRADNTALNLRAGLGNQQALQQAGLTGEMQKANNDFRAQTDNVSQLGRELSTVNTQQANSEAGITDRLLGTIKEPDPLRLLQAQSMAEARAANVENTKARTEKLIDESVRSKTIANEISKNPLAYMDPTNPAAAFIKTELKTIKGKNGEDRLIIKPNAPGAASFQLSDALDAKKEILKKYVNGLQSDAQKKPVKDLINDFQNRFDLNDAVLRNKLLSLNDPRQILLLAGGQK